MDRGMEAKLEAFCIMAKSSRGRAAAGLVQEATSAPGLFVFGELLDMPNIKELEAGEFAPAFRLLQLFAYGTLSDYNAMEPKPELNPAQLLKLKQLTLASLAEANKVLPYAQLTTQLGFPSVRELEDFIITDCMSEGIVKGKLDQERQQLDVHSSLGRDVRPSQLGEMSAALGSWLGTCEQLLVSIEDRVRWAQQAAEDNVRRAAEAAKRQEDARAAVKADLDLRTGGDPGTMFDGVGAGVMDFNLDVAGSGFEDRAGGRPKRRR